jgi:hypothetical protein
MFVHLRSLRFQTPATLCVGMTTGLLAIFLVNISGIAAAEVPITQTPSASKAAVPVTMTECEGTNNCATWTFLGAQGNGTWPSGEIANLSVERYDDKSVVIQRADSTGASAGLTVIYTGTRHGDQVGGEYTSSWPGHWENKTGNWYATVEKHMNPPAVMRVCDAARCGLWTWNDGGYYDGVWSENGNTVTSKITVVSFARESVVINRVNTGNSTGKYVYKGKIASDGNSIVNGDCSGVDNNFFGHFTATWGSALNNPTAATGQVQRQPQTVVIRAMPVVCVPWFFGIVCE